MAHLDAVVSLCDAQGWRSWTHERTAKAFAAPCVTALVAVEDGNVVGVGALLSDGEVIAYLGMLVVDAATRRRGVGRAIISELFMRSGLTRMDLLAEVDATDFYESLPHKTKPGFRIYNA